MTKAELEKEATEWVRQKFPMLDLKQSDMSKIYEYEAYLASAKPREKEIKSLGERCLQLQKDKGNLTNRVKELEAQIEKMKCCGNCKNEKIEGACGHFTQVGWCKNWELAE